MSNLALLIIAYSLSLAVISVPEEMVCIKKVGSGRPTGDSHQCVYKIPGEKGEKGNSENVNATAYMELQSKGKNSNIG